ncbi:uncharacterized protein B0H18DRAFT_1116521 [Fomitopsis serialis]|uniref:uncharacterized protein n=1 Tax=Fomitopsis serialis TaxID=139415 RepID=UPI002007A52B|nr:uncharacterized protein B0H18DRAFT_1116521 [Neoantrodia serialis]KAH9931367.1 hypothetical protein B0H18DRAFT_1116521 [Neoantrodia serialis]
MPRAKRKKTQDYVYVDDGGELIPDGPATLSVDVNGNETIEYLSPGMRVEKRGGCTTHADDIPLPSLLETMANGGTNIATPDRTVYEFLEPSALEEDRTEQPQKKPQGQSAHSITFAFLETWAQKLLNVFRRREADSNIGKPCYKCKNTDAPFRCTECFNGPMLCRDCLIDAHTWNPLHRVQCWNGRFFERKQLSDLGFIFSIGHHGRPCPSSFGDPPTKLTVVHTTGVQTIAVEYCDCRHGAQHVEERPVQLCNAGLWPASFLRPQTVFTFHVLRLFTHLTFQAKTTAHDFYGTLRRLTSNAFFGDVKDRYREFMTAHRQFHYLQTLKRFAVDVKTKLPPGCLALRCPACPHPDINIDPNWRNRPEGEQYKDALHYGKDGNFSLSQHDKKMDHADPPLMDGAAYYVDSEAYRDYLDKMKVYDDAQDETTTCSKFNALSDRYKGKIKTGQVGLSCTRHGFVLPCGTVDLHVGERYANVDYATLSGLRWFHSLGLVVGSYDVNCKYGIHWWKRLKNIASVMPSVPGVTLAKEMWPAIRRCVPKWHLASHTGLCRYFFSFYYTPGVGNTDGESVERRWAAMNAIGRSVREMGPGHRQDVIDAHNSDFNAQKMFKMGQSFVCVTEPTE